jgi:hypothetical protein
MSSCQLNAGADKIFWPVFKFVTRYIPEKKLLERAQEFNVQQSRLDIPPKDGGDLGGLKSFPSGEGFRKGRKSQRPAVSTSRPATIPRKHRRLPLPWWARG